MPELAMPITAAERRILDAVSLDAPWSLIETFATMPRWRAEDVNRAGALIGERLKSLGVPVELHHPTLRLSIPLHAEVRAGRRTIRAKPPSSAASVPQGLTAKLARLEA
ncbi:MAG: hypothetical protein ACRDKL_00580, partial [Solirubrobacteraceae bacterium]